jgi:hypothetical protein
VLAKFVEGRQLVPVFDFDYFAFVELDARQRSPGKRRDSVRWFQDWLVPRTWGTGQLPKKEQATAKEMLTAIPYAQTQDEAERRKQVFQGWCVKKGYEAAGQVGQPTVNLQVTVPPAPHTPTSANRSTPLATRPVEPRPVPIVPKGLRSFDATDADFFLELVPGPRDRDGLPDSIRFWKTRIEEADHLQSFQPTNAAMRNGGLNLIPNYQSIGRSDVPTLDFLGVSFHDLA